MRRRASFLLVLAGLVGALVIAEGAGASTATPGSSQSTARVAGLWTGIDGDGSTMYVAIGRGATPSLFLFDTVAQVCGPGPGWLPGTLTIGGDVLAVTFGQLHCLNGGVFFDPGSTSTWIYDRQTDTIVTDLGFGGTIQVVWHRLV
jgi:hypothetical protein